ncbi:MAG: hypothetical protein WHV44_06045, partial [Anaerolineales bacterium]
MEAQDILQKAEALRGGLSSGFRDEIVKSLYAEAEHMARRAVKTASDKKYDLDQRIDRIVTSPIYGLPIMLGMLAAIIWLTVSGANVVSEAIASILFWLGDQGRALFEALRLPWWITGFVWDGVYRGLAWV